jgi:hypothetical protein
VVRQGVRDHQEVAEWDDQRATWVVAAVGWGVHQGVGQQDAVAVLQGFRQQEPTEQQELRDVRLDAVVASLADIRWGWILEWDGRWRSRDLRHHCLAQPAPLHSPEQKKQELQQPAQQVLRLLAQMQRRDQTTSQP